MPAMSVPVTLDELPSAIERFGNTPYLVTVGAEAQPRATSVRVRWDGELLTTSAGRRTAANLRENDVIVLLWPAPVPGEHALIVDGSAELRGDTVLIAPARAVLHVTRH
jgi:hypothetical protein